MTAPRFTPSLVDGETLAKLFVVREAELARALQRIADAVTSGVLKPTMFVGPRGAGKTHLIALIKHRALDLEGYGTRFSISWIDEDPYRVFDFDSFLREIEESRIGSWSKSEDEPSARPTFTVVLAENFDRIVERLGEEGQRRLRARIEGKADLLLITTAVRMSARFIAAQRAPFYGFFDVIPMKPFTLDQAILMLTRAAEVGGQRALARRLELPDTRNRLAAIQQLAGGQPRMWATFSAGLTLDSVDDLLNTLVAQFDELTPYYQQQLDRLSVNELKAVLALLDTDRALTVKQISLATGISEHSLAPTLRGLVPQWLEPRSGSLQKMVDGRRQYYQLAEPMARVFYQVKRSRGGSIQLAVDFMTAWFTRYEIDRFATQMERASQSTEGEIDPHDHHSSDVSLLLGQQVLRQSNDFLPESLMAIHLSTAMNELGQPDYLLSEQITAGLASEADNYPPVLDEALIAQAGEVDDAIASLQTSGDASAILALPARIAGLIETQLESTSLGMLRLNMAFVAARAGADRAWIDRATEAFAAVTLSDRRTARILISCLRVLVGEPVAGIAGLTDALSESTSAPLTHREWQLIATTASSESVHIDPRWRAQLLVLAAPHLDGFGLAALVGGVVSWLPADTADFNVALRAVAVRLGGAAQSPEELLELVNAFDVEPHRAHPSWLDARRRVALWQSVRREFTSAEKELDRLLRTVADLSDLEPELDLELRADLEMVRAMDGRPNVNSFKAIASQAASDLGRRHPLTLKIRRGIAQVQELTGDLDSSLESYLALAIDEVSALGEAHPTVLSDRRAAAVRAGAIGRNAIAADQYESIAQAEAMRFGAQGLVRPTLELAAQEYGDAKMPGKGVEVLRRLVHDRSERLGPTNRHTIEARRKLAAMLVNAGEFDEAVSIERDLLEPGEQPSYSSTLAIALANAGGSAAELEVSEYWAMTIPKDWASYLSDPKVPEKASAPSSRRRERRAELGAPSGREPLLHTPSESESERGQVVPDGAERPVSKFQLDDAWLDDVGLAQLPQTLRLSYRKFAYSQLRYFVGLGLAWRMSDRRTSEFSRLLRDAEYSLAWATRFAPGFSSDRSFLKLKSEYPEASESRLTREWGSTKFLELHAPHYRDFVQFGARALTRASTIAAREVLDAAEASVVTSSGEDGGVALT